MSDTTGSPDLGELLGRAAWARRLARSLVREDEAEDLLQEAWLATAKAQPSERTSRGWLAGVLRILGMRQARAAGRRRQREAEAVREGGEGTVGPDESLEQVETQRRLSEALLALAEPYRTVLVLRYYEELSSAEIARRTGVPAGTVRWRLKEGLDRLRAQLDERPGGRRASLLALARFAGPVKRSWQLAAGAALVGAGLGGLALLPAQRPLDTPPNDVRAAVPEKEIDMKKNIGALVLAAGLAAHPDGGALAGPPRAIPASKVPRYWTPLGVGPIQGPATAKVTIVAFMDYQSPFCLRASQAINAVLAAHPGEVRYQVIQRPLPFHTKAPQAMRAALAAAQQGKFWQMHDALLAHQDALEPADLEGYAKAIGLDLARFRADLASPTVNSQIELEEANAQSLKVEAIPTFFFNGRSVPGAQPREVLERVLVEELAHADTVLKAGVAPADLYNAITRQGATRLGPDRAAPPPGEGSKEAAGPGNGVFQAAIEVLDKNRGVARTCYDEALALRPGLAGKVIVDVRLARGQEPVVLLHESTMNFAKVDNCIVKALKKLPYPQGTDRLVAVRYVYGFPEVAADRR